MGENIVNVFMADFITSLVQRWKFKKKIFEKQLFAVKKWVVSLDMYQNKAIQFDGLFWTWGHFFGLNSRQPKINDRKTLVECLLFNCRITINIFLCIAQIGGFAVYILFIAKNFQVKHDPLVLHFLNDREHFNKQTILFSLSNKTYG